MFNEKDQVRIKAQTQPNHLIPFSKSYSINSNLIKVHSIISTEIKRNVTLKTFKSICKL